MNWKQIEKVWDRRTDAERYFLGLALTFIGLALLVSGEAIVNKIIDRYTDYGVYERRAEYLRSGGTEEGLIELERIRHGETEDAAVGVESAAAQARGRSGIRIGAGPSPRYHEPAQVHRQRQ